MVLVLQLSLRALGTRPNGFGVISIKRSTWLSMEQLRAILIIASDEQSNAKRSAHDGLLSVSTLAKSQGQIANGLGAALDPQGFVVVESMALTLHAGMFNHRPGISLKARHGTADVAVDFDNLLDGRGFEEGGCDSLFDAEDDALGRGNANGGGSELDSLQGVLNLEETALGGECVDPPVWWEERISYVSEKHHGGSGDGDGIPARYERREGHEGVQLAVF